MFPAFLLLNYTMAPPEPEAATPETKQDEEIVTDSSGIDDSTSDKQDEQETPQQSPRRPNKIKKGECHDLGNCLVQVMAFPLV